MALIPTDSGQNLVAPATAEDRSSVLHQWVVRIAAFVLVFVAICVGKRDVLWLPPYLDQTIGFWAEANYLAETNWDYYALRFEENDSSDPIPGPRTYYVTILPGLLALLMRACSRPETVFLLGHLITFAIAAGIAVLLFQVLLPVTGWPLAGLLCLAACTTPFFTVQTEMLGMDLPMALCSVATLYALWRYSYGWATLFAILAFWCKTTGGILTGALIGYLFLALVVSGPLGRSPHPRRLRKWLLLNVLVLGCEILLANWGDSTLDKVLAVEIPRMLRLPHAAFYGCPDVALLALAALAISLVLMTVWLWRQWRDDSQGHTWARCQAILEQGFARQRLSLFCWIAIFGVILTSSWYLFIPRYFTITQPLLYAAIGMGLAGTTRWRAITALCMTAICALNLANADGRYFPDINRVIDEATAGAPVWKARNTAILERSREYLSDLQSNLALCQTLETRQVEAVVTHWPYSYYLKHPQFGYVSRQFEVVDVADFSNAVERFRDLTWEAKRRDPRSGPVIVASTVGHLTLPHPRPEDEIIYRDQLSDPVVAFRPRFHEGQLTARWRIEEYFLDASWSEDPLTMPWRLGSRLPFLFDSGRLERARHEIQRCRALAPDCRWFDSSWIEVTELSRGSFVPPPRATRLKIELPNVAMHDIELADALAHLWAVDARTADETVPFGTSSSRLPPVRRQVRDSLYVQALSQLRNRNPEHAAKLFRWALDDGLSERDKPMAEFTLGCLLAREGRVDEAKRALLAALHDLPDFAECQVMLGELLLNAGEPRQAAELWNAAILSDRPPAAAYISLGVQLARDGQFAPAESHLRTAIRLDPSSVIAQELLRRIQLHQGRSATNLHGRNVSGLSITPKLP